MILTTQCPTPPHHICEVRPSCWRTFKSSVSLYYSTNSHVYCFCALPLWRERSIPFFCSTNVDPLMKLDIIAIVIPRFWEETAGSPESEAITAALFTSRFFEPQRHPADISASPQVSPASPMSRLKSESSVNFITPLCAQGGRTGISGINIAASCAINPARGYAVVIHMHRTEAGS